MKALWQILLYLAATVLIGALLAPPFFWAAHAAAGRLDNEGLTVFVAKTGFQRYFHRSIMITALALLWPLLRALRIRNFGHDLGLARDRRGWQRLAAGFFLALVTLVILAGIFLFTGVYRFRSHIEYARMVKAGLAVLTVPVLEEFLFRGVLQGVLRRSAADGFSMVAVAVLYAAVHFLSPGGQDPAEVHWWSGLALLPDALSQFRQPALLLWGFTTMLLVGLVLGYARQRTRSLWMPVGLHAGWVLGRMGLPLVTRESQAWPWLGPDILVGLGPLLTVLAVWGIVWLMLRDAG